MSFVSEPNDGRPFPPARLAYQNGRWLEERPAVLINDFAVSQAVTAVERVRAYHGNLFQLPRHLRRWQDSVAALNITGLPNSDRLVSILSELLERNRDWIAAQGDYGALLLASPGSGNAPTLIVDLWPIDTTLAARRIRYGSPVLVTDVVHPPDSSWSRTIKTRCRLHYYFADQQAAPYGNDALGVLIDSDGSITETGIANVMIVEQGSIVQPLGEQILNGVSMQVVRELATEIGLSWTEERISPQRLRSADEILLTGTSCGIWFGYPAGQPGPYSPGPIYTRLREAFETRIAT